MSSSRTDRALCRMAGSVLAALLVCAPVASLGQQPTPPQVAPEKTAAPPDSAKAPPPSPVPVSAKDRREADRLYLTGAKALEKQDLRTADRDFSRASTLDPENADYAAAEKIAHAHLVTQLVHEADKARNLGHPEIARARLTEALGMDPANPIIAQHGNDLADLTLAAPAGEDPSAEMAEAIALAPQAGKHSFHQRSDVQGLLRQVLQAYGITPSFDSSVTGPVVRFDTDDATYEQAAQLLKLQTNTFFVPLDPERVLIARDTKENRTKYQRMLLETVYLPGLTATEMSDIGNLARNLFEAQQATVQPTFGTLTVRAPQTRLVALNRTLLDLLDGKSQLMLDVRLMEVARTRTTNVGVQLPQQFSVFNVPQELRSVIQNNQSLINQIISSGLASANDTAAIVAILIASGQISGTVFNQPFATFGGGSTLTGATFGNVTANLALNSSDTRSLDRVQLRVQDLETATIMSGSRYPIIQSSYSSLAGVNTNIPGLNTAGLSSQLAGLGLNLNSLAQQAIPQVQYVDLGLTMKATPHILHQDRIGLKLDLKIQALAGAALNSIPVLTNRQFTADIDVLNGESTMITSLLSRSESKAVTGIPGLSELPGFHSATDSNIDLNADELVVLITPHIVRKRQSEVAGPLITLPPHT